MISTASQVSQHTSVLLQEMLESIGPEGPSEGSIYVDGTFGAGGYSKAILESANCQVIGIDRDPYALEIGKKMAKSYQGRLHIIRGCFGDMIGLLAQIGIKRIDGVALDIGLSSMQINNPERGFSFLTNGPLDMRMDFQSSVNAAHMVNTLNEEDLANIIYTFGEERASRRIAAAIVETRAQKPFSTTDQLAKLIRGIVKRSKNGIDPATRTFQALRIHVNDELGELSRGLSAAEKLLSPGGRLVVVSFHSLEDRKVKEFLQHRSGKRSRPSRHLPEYQANRKIPSFKLLKRGVIKPSLKETINNPRAKSAKLRAAERTNAPPWPNSMSGAAA